jgi:hypothetical protein
MDGTVLDAMRDVIQEDVGGRGLGTDPVMNLITAFPGDFAAACRELAAEPGHDADGSVAVVTGFFIAHADPPAAETDGPLGALFLARALTPLGIAVRILTDAWCVPALRAGLAVCGLQQAVQVVTLPSAKDASGWSADRYQQHVTEQAGPLGHVIALERVGPSHTAASLAGQYGEANFLHEVPEKERGRCRTMRGDDVTAYVSPAHLLYEGPAWRTIGIGDGGNEIGMGKLGWRVVRQNIARGGLIACQVRTDHLIVSGISNWGAYGLAAGIYHLRGLRPAADLFDRERERELLAVMVEAGPLVDGVLRRRAVSVDGIDFDRYAEPLERLTAMIGTPEGR